MTHSLTPEISSLLDKWDNLGFTCKRQAADFILANKDWPELVRQTFFEEETRLVNEWRDRTIASEQSKALANKGTT